MEFYSRISQQGLCTSLQTLHVYSSLKRLGNIRFHVVSTWNTRGVFVGLELSIDRHQKTS